MSMQAIPPLTILLAEDHPVNQKVEIRMLKKLGYQAEIAANGLESLQALKHHSFDLVLMVVMMPLMDGIEATRIIRERWPHGPKIIIVTAALESYREECIKAGADDFIGKPVKMDELNSGYRTQYVQ
jgi:two-component system sensor histidine kinase/response regulator